MSHLAPQIARASNWLLNSGIQVANGGVARFYRSDREQNASISTEITGYHAGTLAWLHSATANHKLLERAAAAADFLAGQAWNCALQTFPFEYPQPSPAYFFDCGIIVRGLLAVWRTLKTPRYREVAEKCTAAMSRDFDAGFDFHPVLDLPAKTPTVRDPRWSRSSGCYQLKAALAFYEIAHLTGNRELHGVWERILKQSLEKHDQFLPGHADEERVMDRLHAYCYFLEALLATSHRGDCARAIAVGIQRVAYLLHTIEPTFVRADVYAQLLRLRIYADRASVLPLETHTAALEAEQLLCFQLTSYDARIDGGFCFGRKGASMLPYVNPASTYFAIQALDMWHAVQRGSALPSVADLI